MQIDRETIKRMAIEAGAAEMRENCLGGEVFPWGCEFEIEQLEAFVQTVLAHCPEGAPAVPEAQALPSAIKAAPSVSAGAAQSLETGPAQASGFADCCLPESGLYVHSSMAIDDMSDTLSLMLPVATKLYTEQEVLALLTKERTSRQQAQTQLEDMQEKRNRIGLDIDRALKGQVNEQSPIVERLRLIAANFPSGK